MTCSYYVIFNKNGFDRVTKLNGFTLKAEERAIRMVLEVPDEAFEPIPIPTTTVKIPLEALYRPIEAVTTQEEQDS